MVKGCGGELGVVGAAATRCGGEPGAAAVISGERPGGQCGSHLGVAAASLGARRRAWGHGAAASACGGELGVTEASSGARPWRPWVATRKKKTLFWFVDFLIGSHVGPCPPQQIEQISNFFFFLY